LYIHTCEVFHVTKKNQQLRDPINNIHITKSACNVMFFFIIYIHCRALPEAPRLKSARGNSNLETQKDLFYSSSFRALQSELKKSLNEFVMFSTIFFSTGIYFGIMSICKVCRFWFKISFSNVFYCFAIVFCIPKKNKTHTHTLSS
jgi:hypothetical protein